MDQLNDLNSVGSWPLAVKLIMWVLAFVGALTAGYFFHFTNLQTALAKTKAQESALRDDYRQKYFEAKHQTNAEEVAHGFGFKAYESSKKMSYQEQIIEFFNDKESQLLVLKTDATANPKRLDKFFKHLKNA